MKKACKKPKPEKVKDLELEKKLDKVLEILKQNCPVKEKPV